jgi:hypothetical protein
MNSKKIIITGLLALSLAAIGAQAQVLPGSDIGGLINSQPGDIILGFRNSAASSDLAFDIGQFSIYQNVAPGTYTIFGSTAFTATGTQWTVFGGTGGNPTTRPTSTLWATSGGPTLNRSSTQAGLSTSFDNFVNTQMASSSFGGTSDATQLSNKSFTNLASSTSYSGTYAVAVENSTVGTSSLKLWEMTPTTSGTAPGTLLGTFTLTSSALTFTSFAAIPEPSTYAAILGVATLGFVMIRRRKQQQQLLA